MQADTENTAAADTIMAERPQSHGTAKPTTTAVITATNARSITMCGTERHEIIAGITVLAARISGIVTEGDIKRKP